MQTETSPRGSSPLSPPPSPPLSPPLRSQLRRPAARSLVALAVTAAGVAALLTGCGSSDDADSADGTENSEHSENSEAGDNAGNAEDADAGSGGGQDPARVLWLGDSIAGVQGLAMEAAFAASGVDFENASSDGGGTVVEGDEMSSQLAETTWADLTENLDSFQPTVIAYQITTYDWGTPDQQRASYQRLADAAADADAELVLVSAPPYTIDEFYQPHEDEIRSAPEMAEEVANDAGDGVRFLDAGELWGTDAGAEQAQRAPDGIHSCQQGSAAFASWFGEELAERYGFTLAEPEEWATGSWTEDERFTQLGCS